MTGLNRHRAAQQGDAPILQSSELALGCLPLRTPVFACFKLVHVCTDVGSLQVDHRAKRTWDLIFFSKSTEG